MSRLFRQDAPPPGANGCRLVCIDVVAWKRETAFESVGSGSRSSRTSRGALNSGYHMNTSNTEFRRRGSLWKELLTRPAAATDVGGD